MLTFILSLVFTILCILDIVYRFVTNASATSKDFVTYIVILALIYYIDEMITTASYLKAAPGARETILDDGNARFIRDTIYKYLTAWVFGVLFIFELINLMNNGFDKYSTNGKTGETFLKYLDGIFTSLILPVALILDCCLMHRRRCPSFSCDMFVLIGVLIAFSIITIIFWRGHDVKTVLREICNCMILSIFTFDGYIFMDWLIYKFNGTGGQYVLFTSTRTTTTK